VGTNISDGFSECIKISRITLP